MASLALLRTADHSLLQDVTEEAFLGSGGDIIFALPATSADSHAYVMVPSPTLPQPGFQPAGVSAATSPTDADLGISPVQSASPGMSVDKQSIPRAQTSDLESPGVQQAASIGEVAVDARAD
jgi:hypothetical protein